MEIDNKTLFWIGLGVVILVLVGIIIWQTSAISSVSSGSSVAGQVAGQAASSSASSGMVGGC